MDRRYKRILEAMNGREGEVFTTAEIKELTNYENKGSIIPSDYCYNRINDGDQPDKIFEYVKRGVYKYLGPNYKYNGKVYHKPKGGEELCVGYRENGKFISYE